MLPPFIKNLFSTCGVSGYSEEVASVFLSEIQGINNDKYNLNYGVDSLGSVSVVVPSKTTYTKNSIMITSHIDHVGYIISNINKSIIQLAKVGIPYLEGSCKATIKTTTHKIYGTIIDEDIEEEYAELKLENEKDFEYISIGDPVYYYPYIEEKPKGKYTGCFMDNKISIFSSLETIKKVSKLKQNKNKLYFVLTALEEVGCFGAIAAINKIKPEFVVNLDIFPVNNKRDLSYGVAISRGPIYNDVLYKYILNLAKKNNIPHRTVVGSIQDESDATYMIAQNGGTPCCEIGVPCLNTHKPHEMVSKKSVKALIDLLTLICINTDTRTNLVPGEFYNGLSRM